MMKRARRWPTWPVIEACGRIGEPEVFGSRVCAHAQGSGADTLRPIRLDAAAGRALREAFCASCRRVEAARGDAAEGGRGERG